MKTKMEFVVIVNMVKESTVSEAYHHRIPLIMLTWSDLGRWLPSNIDNVVNDL